MSRLTKFVILFFLLFHNNINAKEDIMILKLKNGEVKIQMYADAAPNHVNRIKELVGKLIIDSGDEPKHIGIGTPSSYNTTSTIGWITNNSNFHLSIKLIYLIPISYKN